MTGGQGPGTAAGREILASNRRVIEDLREQFFPHMVGEPIEQTSLTKLVVIAEEDAAAEASRSVRGLLAYLWTATGKNPDIRVCDLFNADDPLVRDVEAALSETT